LRKGINLGLVPGSFLQDCFSIVQCIQRCSSRDPRFLLLQYQSLVCLALEPRLYSGFEQQEHLVVAPLAEQRGREV
jgi:hypothetical protein